MNPEEPPRYQAQPYQPQPYQPQPPVFGGMNEVQTSYTRVVRPPVVILAAVFWLLAALAWPAGRMIVQVGLGESGEQLWWVGNVFLVVCTVAAVGWPLLLFLRGSAQARLTLTLLALVFGIFAFAFLFTSDGPFVALQVVRLVLPVVAIVLSFLPGARWFFAANLQ